jgi:hypothetical protein
MKKFQLWFAPFSRDWWQYMMEPNHSGDRSRLAVMWCRMRGHPHGVWWYNVGGYEPDMHCKTCGDNLG